VGREEFSQKTKRERWALCGGHCEVCNMRLAGRAVEYHHERQATYGGGNDLSNCRVLCVGCHSEITRRDAPIIAKSNRIRNRDAGIKKQSKFACSRTGKWKKKVDGTVVPR
jgi:5-methylcytosine-specific restriction endonuclease McrA